MYLLLKFIINIFKLNFEKIKYLKYYANMLQIKIYVLKFINVA